ncbi:MAG: hypothetical protein ACYC3Q_03500 [Gemmatimonadaceae bacterium]
MSARRGVRLAAHGLAATLLAGCYTTRRVSPEHASPAQPVRLWVGMGGAAALVPAVGPGVSQMEGEVLSRDDSMVTLRLQRLTRRDGGEETFAGDPVSIRLSAIDSAFTRRLDRRRSLLLGGGVVAGAWLVRALADQSGFIRTSIGKPGGSQ